MDYPPVRGDNPRALVWVVRHVRGDNPRALVWVVLEDNPRALVWVVRLYVEIIHELYVGCPPVRGDNPRALAV